MMRPVTDPNLIKQLDAIRLSQQPVDNLKQVTDPELIKQLDAARMQQSNSDNSINLFKVDPDVVKTMPNFPQMMQDPRQMAKDTMQAVGLLGMGLAPELSVFKGAGMLPGIGNALSRSGVSGGFGAMANPDNPLMGGIMGAVAPPISRFATKTIPALIQKTTPEKIGNYLQQGYNTLKGKAEDLFQHVGKEAVDRGINILPIDPSFIRTLTTYFPKTNASRKLLQNAEQGDYEALRKLQSDLFHRGNKGSNAILSADRDMAEEMLEKRNELNTFIHDYFKNTGHEDLSNKLMEARNLYRELQEIYHTTKLPKSIRDIYDPELLKVSPKIEKILNTNTKPINKLIQSNPLVASELEKGAAHQNALKTIKRLGLGTGLGLGVEGALSAVNFARNLFKKE
jgi:hypothetical protein